MTQYNVLTASTAAKLAALVQAAIADGWQPLGGVSVALEGSPDHGWLVFAQAVVRVVTP